MFFLNIGGWIVVGLIVGFIVSKFVNLRGDDPRLGIGCAAVGALIGGILYRIISQLPISGFNPWSLLCAALGAVVAVIVWHLIRSRTISRDSYVPRRSY